MNPLTQPTFNPYHLDKSYLSKPLSFGSFQLFQIGRLYCTEQTVVGKHAHINWFELTIVTDGKGIIYTNDVAIPVHRGDIYLSFPCDFHAISSDPNNPLKYDFFSFATEDDTLSEELELIMQSHMSADSRIIQDERIAALVSDAIAEMDDQKPYSVPLLTAIFTQIVIRMIRIFLYDTANTLRIGAIEPKALCYRLMNYIDTHIYTMTGLGELADLTNYNYSYLSSLFRKVTARTLNDYYRSRRLETARLLILENEWSISHIAELLHYSSIYTFSRSFKDEYGLSPEQYRKAHFTERSS